MIRLLAIVPAVASLVFVVPAQDAKAPPAPATASGPKAAAALEPLAFMTGAWTQQQANGAMIEEHWMAPRGQSMLGSFRRILGNGGVPFYEFTQIVAEKDRVVHGNFDPDPKRTEPMLLVLEKVVGKRATFVPVADPAKAHAGDLSRVTYSADGPDTLVLVVEPKAPEGKPAEKPLEFRMTRIK